MPPVFRSAFQSYTDETSGQGRRPVIFDVLGPDKATSLLPDGLRMVLHVNPSSMRITYAKQTDRVQTRGGFVEFHWGNVTQALAFEQATGGFVRLYTGLSNRTAPGGRRQTIAYQKYLDLLALFHHNGSIYDHEGNIVVQGYIKITFDGGVYIGWFSGLTVEESADKPYQFTLSSQFTVDYEVQAFRSQPTDQAATTTQNVPDVATSLLDPLVGF